MQLGLATILLLAGNVAAVPAAPLEPRSGSVVYDKSCDGPLPAGSKYAHAGFKTMKDVVQHAFADAQTLANRAQGVADTSKGFTHYFKPDELQNFRKMMTGISSGGPKQFSVKFVCVAKIEKDTKTECSPSSIMVTNYSPGGPNDQKLIEACPKFFTSSETQFLLYNSAHTKPTPPWRDKSESDDGWCAKARPSRDSKEVVSKKDVNFYVTAGHTVLHELTHLDSLGKFAGVPANKEGNGPETHGTRDLRPLSTPKTAREVLTTFHPPKTAVDGPVCNAESYAAAATEIYFMNLCGFDEIGPTVGSTAGGGC